MFDFQQKRQIKKVIYSRLTILTLFLVVLFLGRSTYDIFTRYELSKNNYLAVKKDYDNLKTRESMLNSEIERLKTDSGIEEEIRSRFSVSKPGEVVVTVVDNNPTTTGKNDLNTGLWARFMALFQ